MADAVATHILVDGPKTAVMKFTNISDGTGESAVTKVDASALAGSPSEVRITQIWCDSLGVAVDILWDATTDVLAHTITSNNNGHWDYRCFGGLWNNSGAGKTGDIKFTTIGASSNNRYTIVLELSKVY